MAHIRRDQAVWMLASIMGMALPCMMSLEFIRNATVTGDRVAAMTAEGIALRYPELRRPLLDLDPAVRFPRAGSRPGQRGRPDRPPLDRHDLDRQPARSSDWGGAKFATSTTGFSVVYGIWGLLILWLLPALRIAEIGAVLGNVALGGSSLQALYVNRKLLPKRSSASPAAATGRGALRRLFPGDQHRGDRDAVRFKVGAMDPFPLHREGNTNHFPPLAKGGNTVRHEFCAGRLA